LGTFLGLVLAYSVNGRVIPSGDTDAVTFTALAIVRGDGIALDRFRTEIDLLRRPYWVTEKRGHLISRYPVAPALLAAPLFVPQVALLDRWRPGWDADALTEWFFADWMGKNVAVLIAASTGMLGMILYRRLRIDTGTAVLAVVVGVLGSDLWVVASQSLWQHGPAALALTAAMVLLVPAGGSRARTLAGGIAVGLLVAFRLLDGVLGIPVLAAALWRDPRRAGWLLSGPIVLGGATAWYNYHWFGTLVGGQAELEAMHETLHAVAGSGSRDILGGAAGTLVSPSRGLFVFCPWIAITIVALPGYTGRLRQWPILAALMWSVPVFGLVLSTYAVWWGGTCFGPRFWTDVVPFFAVLFAFAVEWSRESCRPVFFGTLLAAGLCSVLVQGIGAFCYPSSWSDRPVPVDRHHERLWDWRDSEIARCLREGAHPASTAMPHGLPKD
jgi:hypothetical protein